MVSFLSNFLTSFVLGVLTPLTAVCVLPLYPGFLSYLSNQLGAKDDKKQVLKLSLLVSSGVVSFMVLLGIIFTTILETSLTKVIDIVSPIAFFILGVISIFLIFNINVSKFLPTIKTPTSKNPLKSAFLFGFFLGAIILPCNPLFIAALFTRAVTVSSYFVNVINFLFFGFGISFPLVLLAVVSLGSGRKFINLLIKYKRGINFVSGVIMLVISIYYLFFVFKII